MKTTVFAFALILFAANAAAPAAAGLNPSRPRTPSLVERVRLCPPGFTYDNNTFRCLRKSFIPYTRFCRPGLGSFALRCHRF